MVVPQSHKKDASISDLFMKVSGKGTAQTNDNAQPAQSSTISDSIISTDDTEPVTRTFLESLFGALRTDIATLKQVLAKDMNKLGDRVDTLDHSGEELAAHQREILELQDRNTDLRSQVEDLENRSRRADIRIKGVLLQATGGNLEENTSRLFHHIAQDLAPHKIVIERVHRAG
ncbi:hypothetical protein NDU88_005089 [Pleurodeles waltl]|uniref:Uncharacterized protein n=1 Tax=Pleurodeles waltl TaxID=8319 RepID=A0AAV7MA06_PLEWA|nr:hypothetical protein NDU88_005089 [Pleurodeles waltl]